MKRKFLLVVTIICLVFSTVAEPLNIVSAETISSSPKVGDVTYGFDLTKIDYDSSTKSTKYLFIHEKTGAKLLVLKNSDKNRGFSIKFNTAAENDKGINHIIEHSVLGGSEKYPSSNILFDVMNATYISYANAYTYQNMTVFPICSASEEQLLKSTDTYLDAVFHPLLLSDEKIFEREGWRYELAKDASNLTYNGIVYNEMQGNMGNIETAAYYNAQKAIFPDSNQGNISGGDPKAIKQLTYKELISTYKKNYHPSNSFMVLYGDVDYEAFLKMIDENYLSSYSKQTYTINKDTQKAFSKLSEKTYTYPVAKGEDTNNKSVIDLVFAASDLKKLGAENYVGLNIAVSLLNIDSSEIKQAMLGSKIADSYSITLGGDTYQPTIHFIATNADPTKKKDFYNLVMKELNKLVKTGLDSELVKSSLRSFEFKKALGNDSSTAVQSLLNSSMYDNLFGNSLFNYDEYYKKIVSKLDDKILENIIQKQIINNKTAALTVTTPKEGLLEKNEKETTEALTKKKASMSKKQIKELVKQTKEFNTWNNQKTSDEVLKSLRAVSLKDLSTETRDRNIKETTVDGAKLLTANADIESISSIYLNFDLSHLTSEELLYLKFYGDMVGSGMATENRTESQVMNDTALKANSISASVATLMDDKKDTSAHPIFGVYYYSFEDEYADTFDLVSDILLQSNVSDISNYGTRTIANLKYQYQSLFAEPLTIALMRSLAYTSPSNQYSNYFTGLDYYNFILSLEKQIETNPSEVAEKITAVRTKAFNKNNLTVLFAGDSSAQEKFKSSMPNFTQKLPDKTYQKAVFTLPKPARREALTTNVAVQYVCVNGSLSANNVSMSGKSDVITGILNNMMLTPEIRLKGGAYGVSASFYSNNYIVYTYRDSNFVNSLTKIGETDEFLKALSPYMTEENLESYKLSAYAAATQSSGEINDALANLVNHCQGVTTQDKIASLKELKETSIADLQNYSNYLEKVNSNWNYVVVASPSEIEANKDLFDTIIPLP